MKTVIVISGIIFIAFIIISLVLWKEKDATTKECLAKKVYKASLFCAFGSAAITVIGFVFAMIFREVAFFTWFFNQVASCIFVAGFLMIPIGQHAARYIPDNKQKERKTNDEER